MWRTRPVFISSTFVDMQAERDYLRTRVFPELEEKLRARRHNLEWVDLRVGVATASLPDEQVRELHVLKVCLAEVKRCRPFLIVLLGDRYGWVPPPERIREAAREERFSAEIVGRSVTDLEIDFGVLSDPEQQQHSMFYFREPLPYHDMQSDTAPLFSDACSSYPSAGEAADRVRRLAALKQRIAQQLPDRVRHYAARWDAEHRQVAGLESWGRMVLEDIWSELEAATEVASVAVELPWHQAEHNAMEDFAEDRARDFVGRQDMLAHLTGLAGSVVQAGDWGACVTGDPGTGKSALFGELYRRLSQADAFILAHAAGASLQSGSVDSMLRRWIEDLATALGADSALPENAGTDEVDAAFASLLGRMAQQRRVILLIDALDQFEPTVRGRYVTWLPRLWPDNARVITTAIPGEASKALTERSGVEAISLPPLDAKEARDIITTICARYHREFEPPVIEALLRRTGVDGPPWTNPLWLVLAIEELNLLDAEDFARARHYAGSPAEQLRALMLDHVANFPADIRGLYSHTFDRAEELFGTKLTRGFLGLIAVSRAGWRESDFRILLPRASDQNWDALQFAYLRRLFRGQMRRRNALGQWDFNHAQMRAAALARLATQEVSPERFHTIIADRLLSCRLDDPLRQTETMFHLLGSEDSERAAAFYGDRSLTDKECDGATGILADRMLAFGERDEAVALQDVVRLLNVASLNNKLTAATTGIVAHRLLFKLGKAIADRAALPLRTALANRILETLTALNEVVPDDQVQYDLAIVHMRIGELLQNHGRLDDALTSLRTSEKILLGLIKSRTEPVSSEDTFAPAVMTAYVDTCKNIGDVLKKQGNLVEAIKAYRVAEAGIHVEQTLENVAKLPKRAYWQTRLSVSHDTIGGALQAQGNFTGALQSYRASLAIRESLAAAHPGDLDRQSALAWGHSRMGIAYLEQGNLPEALKSLRQSLVISTRLVAADPPSTRWRFDLAQDQLKIGDALLAQGGALAARKAFRESLAIIDGLATADPGNATLQRDLGQLHDRIGKVSMALRGKADTLQREKNLAEALASFRLSLAIANRLADSDPGNAERQRDLAVAHVKIGDVFLAQRNATEALRSYRDSLVIRERLAAGDPSNAEKQRALSVAHSNIGDALVLTDLLAAWQSYEVALSIDERLAKSDPTSTALQVDVAVGTSKLAVLLLGLGCIDEALAAFQNARGFLAPLVAASPGQADWVTKLSHIDEQIAKLQLRR